MADSAIRLQIEAWVRKEWLPQKFGCKFKALRLPLRTGGHFDFDAVNEDNSIIVNISTSSARTISGNLGVGKFHKLRGDILFLTMVNAEKKYILLTEKDMYQYFSKQKEDGRVPEEIMFLHVRIPEDLNLDLVTSKLIAAQEVTPEKSTDL